MKPENIDVENPYVCIDCGNKYMTEIGMVAKGVSTMHSGECCCCRQIKGIVHERSYMWLYKWKQDETTEERTSDR